MENRAETLPSNHEQESSLPEVQGRAVEKFGLTEDPYKSSFILSDGSYLPSQKGASFEAHRGHLSIGELYPPGMNAEEAELKFLNSGAIRFSKSETKERSTVLADFTRIPNTSQLTVLVRAARGVDRVILDLMSPKSRSKQLHFRVLTIPLSSDIFTFVTEASKKVEMER